MNPRSLLFMVACGAMGALAAFAPQREQPKLLLLDWAAKAGSETPPVAVLIELGLKDDKPQDWSGRASVNGAKVVHREGYRFRDGDKLVEPDAWEVSSHRPLRAPQVQPAVIRMEGFATVGIVLHLTGVQPGAVLRLEPKDKEFDRLDIPLKDVLSGQPKRWGGEKAVVRRISVATPVVTAKTEDDFPAAAYGPDGTLWVAYISYALKEEGRRIEQTALKAPPENFKALYTPEFRDQLFVKAYRNGKWAEPIAVTGPNEDLVRCAIAAESNGDVWVAYTAFRDGKETVYLAPVNKQQGNTTALKLPQSGGPNIKPCLCTDANGQLRVASQGWGQRGRYGIFTSVVQKGQVVGGREIVAEHEGENAWNPVLAAGPNGKTALAFDVYRNGDYDVQVVVFDGTSSSTEHWVASSSRFEARPSVAYDAQGRLWIAYEEGPEQWGKDSGALARTGNPLYSDRSVRVVCLDTDGKLKRPMAELPTSAVGNPGAQVEATVTNRNERATRYSYPQLGIDGKGRLWLTYRQNFGSRYTTNAGNYWLNFARRLDGDHWSEPMELHHSDGLLDSRPVLLPHSSGGLLVLHNTDGRHTTPQGMDNQIYLSIADLPGDPVEPKLVSHNPGQKDPKLVKQAEEERNAVKRLRAYRIEVGGKKYQPLRGEFHRHTEISWDGAADGSLEDMFRYGIDCAAMDWIGNGDHDSGAGREYSWWLIQKLTDAYHVPNTFMPMFTYERSVAYPMGHRNCVFAKRGIRCLPRLAAEPGKAVGGVHPDDTKMLYRYLKELDGICASHTSATTMGTDWRDNDPQVEPIVEIYQGDRMSYEYQGAPRAGYDPKTGQQPANIGGWFPAGFLDHALKEKGYRLGFQASSDHWSTHISYCIALAERHDREAILDAMKKRHCYGATDDILLDVRSGSHLMGDEFKTGAAPALELAVIGTGPIAEIVILKDSQVVATIKPDKQEYKGNWTDPKPSAGIHYYYVRVQQTDGQLAWGSPMWIDYAR
jgi:hypothetical protein